MEISYFKDIYEMLSRKHPNSKIYIISDHHFFHKNILAYQRQEFNTLESMHEFIIHQHNQVIEEKDIVLFLGDFSFKKSEIFSIVKQMKGIKYLLMGNHDQDISHNFGNYGFEGIFTIPVKLQNIYLSHQPLLEEENMNLNLQLLIKEFQNSDGMNYHGHLHKDFINNPRYHNVCCEVINYQPIYIGTTKFINNDKELFINTEFFSQLLKVVHKEKNINPRFLISDYIYSSFLNALEPYEETSFIYGSYPLYKKYGLISNFSDLDVVQIYNPEISKGKNVQILKLLFQEVFDSVKTIDDINFSLYKKFNNMAIFEFLYANKDGHWYKGYFDSNLVPLNCYKKSDFVKFTGGSYFEFILEKMGIKPDCLFPKYDAQFLTINGDIANLILQILFQSNFKEKKKMAFSKLKNIYNTYGIKDIENVLSLDDMITRFFLRNLSFFHMTKRKNEFDYIKEVDPATFRAIFTGLPDSLKNQLEEIFLNSSSVFSKTFQEIKQTKFEEITKKNDELIRSLKK